MGRRLLVPLAAIGMGFFGALAPAASASADSEVSHWECVMVGGGEVVDTVEGSYCKGGWYDGRDVTSAFREAS